MGLCRLFKGNSLVACYLPALCSFATRKIIASSFNSTGMFCFKGKNDFICQCKEMRSLWAVIFLDGRATSISHH